jgi:hypothetical protein
MNKNPSKTLAALVVAFFCLSGCWPVKPNDHICASAVGDAKSYCYARTTLNDLITAANLSRVDGSLSESSHDEFLFEARRISQVLDGAEAAIEVGGDPVEFLTTAKRLLLEIQ